MNKEVIKCIVCGSPTTMFFDRIWDDRYGCPGVFRYENAAPVARW